MLADLRPCFHRSPTNCAQILFGSRAGLRPNVGRFNVDMRTRYSLCYCIGGSGIRGRVPTPSRFKVQFRAFKVVLTIRKDKKYRTTAPPGGLVKKPVARCPPAGVITSGCTCRGS